MEQVGNAFVNQYYNVLHQSPQVVHRFYTDSSHMTRAEAGADGAVDVAHTQDVSTNFERLVCKMKCSFVCTRALLFQLLLVCRYWHSLLEQWTLRFCSDYLVRNLSTLSQPLIHIIAGYAYAIKVGSLVCSYVWI